MPPFVRPGPSALLVLERELAFVLRNAVSYCHFQRHRSRCYLSNLALHRIGELAVPAQIVFCVLPPLAQSGVSIGEEGAALADDLQVSGNVEDAALARNPLVVHDVELGGSEGWSDFV